MRNAILLVLTDARELAAVQEKLHNGYTVFWVENVEAVLQALEKIQGIKGGFPFKECMEGGSRSKGGSPCNDHPPFIQQVYDHITANLHNPLLHVEELARELNMSRPTLYRKIKSVTGHTPNELINTMRMELAVQLLEAGNHRVNEIARMTGFHSTGSFGKAFARKFNRSPTSYQRQVKRVIKADL